MAVLDPDPDNLVNLGTRRAVGQAVQSADDSPDDATRALELSNATGVHPAIVHGDLENFEQQHKVRLASDIVRSNQFIQEYINSHPLAAKVSNDDYGQLDAVSQAVQKHNDSSILMQAIKGFGEGFGSGGLGGSYFPAPKTIEEAQEAGAGGLIGAGAALFGGLPETTFRVAGGVLTGLTRAAEQIHRSTTGAEPEWGEKFLHAISDPGTWASIGIGDPLAQLHHNLAHNAELRAEVASVAPYIEQGKPIPVGVHELVDEAHVEQAKVDSKNLGEALKESAKSATRERSPELFSNFIRQHTGEADIGISADAVRALYGDKVPAPDDNILGFVPDIAAKLQRAEATGGDIQVSVADYLAKVEPEVHKELADHIRARPEGVTVEEGKELEKPEGQPAGPVDSVRQAAGLQGIQERKLTLRRDDTMSRLIGDKDTGDVSHAFTLLDAEGKEAGMMDITEEKGGKRLFVDDVNAEGGPQSMGPRAMRDVLEQLKEQFPNAETIEGMRVSGAREKANKENVKTSVDLTKIKPRAKAPIEEGEKEPFTPAPPGFTIQQYELYLKNIAKRTEQDAEKANARIVKEQRRTQSAEWKENEIKQRPSAVEAVQSQPNIVADSALREGSVRIHPGSLTAEQRKALPKEYLDKGGLTADQAATRFGFTTGDQMVEAVSRFNDVRKQSGMRASDFTRRLISMELDRQMKAKYGDLEANVLKEAKDQVLSEVQEEMLHQQTMRYAELAGEQYPIRKEPTIKAMREDLDGTPIGQVSSDALLADAGRAGRALELADLKGDWAEGFRQSQLQKNAIIKAKMALAREDQIEKFEKLMKKFSSRDPKGVATEHTNFIHQIMDKLGLLKSSTRSATDLAEEIARKGYPDLASFVSSRKNSTFGMDQMPVADFLMDEKWSKPFKSLTGDEFDQVHDSVAALAKMGSDEKKLIDRGNAWDLAKSIEEIKDELKTFPLKQTSATPTLKSKILYYPRSALASATTAETMFNRFDRNNPRGPGNRYVNYVLAAGANGKDKLIREFSKPMQALGKVKDQEKLVESPLIDPLTITDENPSGNKLANFTNGNVQTMIHNAGNESNWRAFARGWGQDPVELFQWLQAHSTKEMWDRGQQMGKTIFKPAFEKAQASYERIYGVAPAKLELSPFEIRHPDGATSQYEGWYHPLIPDPAREFFIDADGKMVSGQSVKQRGGSAYDGPDNFHARTTNGYTKSRTGAAYPVDLNPDMIPVRLTQMLHDVAYREGIINVEKIFRNPGFRNELTKHYGKAYTDGLNPYLQSLAGEMGIPSKAYADAQRVSEYFRQNVVGTYIGFNPSTPLKHGPTAWGMSMWQAGPGAWARATWDIYARGEAIHDANKAWIDDTFEEVGRRRRFWQDTISGQHADIYGEGTSREKFIEAGSWAVSQSDMFSVRGTALALYRKELARQEAAGEELNHGEAIDIANQGVRFAHGSTSAANRPAMVRGGGPLGSWMTSIYGFMGTIMQRRIEIVHVIADQYRDVKAGEFKDAFNKVPDLAGRIVTHVILPIAIEEMVTGLTTDDRRGWGEHTAVAMFDGLARSALYVRDIAYSLMGSHAPSAGLMTGIVDDARRVVEDVKKGKHILTGPNAGKFVGDTMTALGDLTGRSTKTLGAATRFGINYGQGYEKPKTPGDWYRGLARGTTKARLVQ
jgi:Large polyvalent protein associated domain 22